MADPVILVFGKNGQVAQELARLSPEGNLRLTFAGRDACDLLCANPGDLIRSTRPLGVINASAYTAVDKAEAEREAADQMNHRAVAAMAKACAQEDIPFVHISTDYVFDGTKAEPYVETDPRRPLSVYGSSKAAGEDAVEAAGGQATVFRTAWVISPFGANFVKTMRRLATERSDVSVVADQHGRPTLASDVAFNCLNAIERFIDGDTRLRGVFHLAGADDAVWSDVAERVFEDCERRFHQRPKVKTITTAEYPTAATRPANSRLDSAKLQLAVGWRPRPWRESIDICLEALSAQ